MILYWSSFCFWILYGHTGIKIYFSKNNMVGGLWLRTIERGRVSWESGKNCGEGHIPLSKGGSLFPVPSYLREDRNLDLYVKCSDF